MIRIVSQTGSLFTRPRPGSVRTTKVATMSSLSAIGSSQAPKAGAPAEFPRDEAVEQVGETRDGKHDQRPPEVAVDRQDDEGRHEHHPREGELVCRREDAHFAAVWSRSIRVIASIASAPLTGRESWNRPSGRQAAGSRRPPRATHRHSAGC